MSCHLCYFGSYNIIITVHYYCLLGKELTSLVQSPCHPCCPIKLELVSVLCFPLLGKKLLAVGWELIYFADEMVQISVIQHSLSHITLPIHPCLHLEPQRFKPWEVYFSIIPQDCFRAAGSSLLHFPHSETQVDPVVTTSVAEGKEYSFEKGHIIPLLTCHLLLK